MKKLIIIVVAVLVLLLLIVVGAMLLVRPAENSSIDALRTIPYLDWVPLGKNSADSGVTVYDQGRAFNGLNIYATRDPSTELPRACLTDMNGNVLYTWSARDGFGHNWQYVEMQGNGDLLVIVKDAMFMKIDRDSNVKWIQTGRFHHDFCVAENGDIYAISRHSEYLTYPDLTGFILNDYITVLSSDGTVKGNISLFDVVKEEISPERLAEINHSINSRKNLRTIEERMGSEQLLIDNGTDHDILHTNTVEEVTRDIEGVCRKGDLLISIREMDLIGILNLAQKKLVWQWGPGVLDEQHHPSLLENGNILVFDNGRERDYSRLLELDPRTKEIVWEYKADPSNAFFTVSGGSCQRLPNGNTLICESARGHAFEVTPDGDIVWEFFNPSIKKGKKRRASLYRFMRIVDPENYPFLETLSQS